MANALDAEVPLRDAQNLARPAGPRTTEHYDRARSNLARHGVHSFTAYGGATAATRVLMLGMRSRIAS